VLTFWKSLRQKGGVEYLVLIPILILAAILCCYRIAEPGWEELPQGYTLSEYLIVARNYLKFGYFATKFGQVIDYGWTKPEGNFTYRVDHPPLFTLLISLSFRLFGTHEWSVRLIPVLSSLLILLLVFILAREWGGKKTALLASFFLVLTPMHAYYSRLPAMHFLATFFSLLTFVFYYWWAETGKRSYYLGMYISLVLGALSDWVAYLVVPAILLHYVIYEYRKSRSLRFVFLFALMPVMLFGIHLGWAYLLQGKGMFKGLFDLFLYRTISKGPRGVGSGFTLWDFCINWHTRSILFLTPTIWLLSILGSITLVAGLFRKESSRRNAFVLALFLFGLGHNLLFSNRVFVHDYIMLFHLLPFFAIAAALGAQYIAERVLLNKWQWTAPFILAICYFCATQSTSTLEQLHNTITLPDLYLLGSRINEITDEKARIVTSFPVDLRMAAYADRPWSVTRSLSGLSKLQTNSSYNYYVMDDTWPVDKDLREYLIKNHPMETFGRYRLFDLWETGSNVSVREPQIEHLASINFGDKLMFLGYNVEEVVEKKREPSWLEKYLNAHADLLPKHRTTFRITYFWQCLEEMEKDYTLMAQFEGRHGRAYRLEQSHQGVNGAYPTSSWQVGEVIREEYKVEIPVDYPPVKYTLWVGVQDQNKGENLGVVGNLEHDEGNRVRLGEIEVLPAERPSPLMDEPQPQTRVKVDINDELLFLGYDLNKSDLTASDELKIATYWQSLRQDGRDYEIKVEMRGGGYKARQLVELAPTRLWQEGEYYRGDTVMPVNPYVLEGPYSLNLTVDNGQSTTAIGLATLNVHSRQRRHILERVMKANYGGGEIISPEEPFSLRFNLKEREAVELLAGWTGRSEFEETRVEVYITNAYWSDTRYLGTWMVESGDYQVKKRKIGKVFTAPGENVIELRVPEMRERVHNIGWRGVLDLLFPDLLQDISPIPYDGAIQMDFAQVSTRWEGDWDDYYDLAKVYAERGMQGEVVRLYEEAVDKGVEPGRVDELALFKRAYAALGEQEKVGEIEERIAGRIAHKMNVNLGGKVEFLGHSLRGEEGNGHGLSLFFRCLEEMEEDYTLWVHGEVEDESLLEGQRREAGYAVFDHWLPTSRWRGGEAYQDDEVRGLRPGRYHFTLGLWRPEDGSRLWREDDPNAHIIDLGWVEVK
jgi:4-amino-4-deoxy-L-arabinose transferase-like glycosyltransferase